jgi:hypothetical protein
MNLNGYRIIVTSDMPKMRLAADVMVSPDFRKEINDWMAKFFGHYNTLEDGQVMVVEHLNVVYTNPRTFAELPKLQAPKPSGDNYAGL